MRHQVAGRKFNRDANHRKSLIVNLVRGFVLSGHLTTSIAKAKTVRPIADKMIHKAVVGGLANKRMVHRFFGKREVVNVLFDQIAPVMKDRTSGYTKLTNLGHRKGDDVEVVRLELIVPMQTKVEKMAVSVVKQKSTKKSAASVSKKTDAAKKDASVAQKATK